MKSVVQKVRSLKMFSQRLNKKNEPLQLLDEKGAEVCDPVPHATTIGIRHADPVGERIRRMLMTAEMRRNPNMGMENDDDDDFDVKSDDPLYDFERRHERIAQLEAELQEANTELEDAKAEFKKKRAAEVAAAEKIEPKTPDEVLEPEKPD